LSHWAIHRVFSAVGSRVALGGLVLALHSAVPASARPVEGATRIGLQGGYRYVPNGRFAELAGEAGHPLATPSLGGPAVLGVFGYRPMETLEVALELGWVFQRFHFEDGQTMQLNQLPVSFALRWAPWPGTAFPYLVGGAGYFLNFLSGGPAGSLESHAAAPFGGAGVSFELADRVSAFAEYRFSVARVEVTGLGYLHTGGNLFMLGIELSFAAEEKRL
jgi:hypothetical protein